MKPWERVVFGLIALSVLAAIGVKLHELDMPVARFVRSFDIDELNRLGDLVALPGQGVVVVGAFALIALIGWRRQRDQLAPMTFSMAGLIERVRTWWPQRDQLTDIGARGLLAQLSVAGAIQILKHLIGRPRPRFAHGDELVLGPSLDSGLDSFPSGHAANAFGAATVLAWFFPAVRIPLFLVAGLVAVSRVLRGSHFPTDVWAGAVLGVVIGSMAAVGLKRWPSDALPGLLGTYVPVAVSTFAIFWVLLHPAPAWSQEIISLWAGSAGGGYGAGGLGRSPIRGGSATARMKTGQQCPLTRSSVRPLRYFSPGPVATGAQSVWSPGQRSGRRAAPSRGGRSGRRPARSADTRARGRPRPGTGT